MRELTKGYDVEIRNAEGHWIFHAWRHGEQRAKNVAAVLPSHYTTRVVAKAR